MIVSKFGGSSVASKEQFEKVKRIVDANSNRKFIVVSACGKENRDDYKVTDLLYLYMRILIMVYPMKQFLIL